MGRDRVWFRLDVQWDESDWLADLPWHVRAVWPVILAHVKTYGRQGKCDAPVLRRFAAGHDIPLECIEVLLEAAGKEGAMEITAETWQVTKWAEYQGAESLERVRRFRDRNATEPDAPVTVTDETPRNVTAVTERYPVRDKTITDTDTNTPPIIPPKGVKVCDGMFEIPPEFSPISDTLSEFITMRTKSAKKPPTVKAMKLILGKLPPDRLDVARAMLEQSICNSWQNVYPLKDPPPASNGQAFKRI